MLHVLGDRLHFLGGLLADRREVLADAAGHLAQVGHGASGIRHPLRQSHGGLLDGCAQRLAHRQRTRCERRQLNVGRRRIHLCAEPGKVVSDCVELLSLCSDCGIHPSSSHSYLTVWTTPRSGRSDDRMRPRPRLWFGRSIWRGVRTTIGARCYCCGGSQASWMSWASPRRLTSQPRPGGIGPGRAEPTSAPSSLSPDSTRPGDPPSRSAVSTGWYIARPAPPLRRARITCSPTSRACGM